MEIKDLIGLGKPLTKLVEVIGNATGTWYKPKAIRNEADAKAYETEKLAIAEAKASLIKQTGEAATQQLINNPEFMRRVQMRFVMQEVERQVNLDRIAEFAEEELADEVAEEPVSDDWRRRFFDYAGDICESDVQKVWGKLLADEVAKPGSFSLRTLDVLRNMSSHEANLFSKLCSATGIDGAILQHKEDSDLEECGLTFNDLVLLTETGLLTNNEFQSIGEDYDATPAEDGGFVILRTIGDESVYFNHATKNRFEFQAIVLSNAGKELQTITEKKPSLEYFKQLADFQSRKGYTVRRVLPEAFINDNTTNVNILKDNLAEF